MKKVTFEAAPGIQTDLTDNVAVEILDRKLTRKGRTTFAKPVSLDDGRYIAQATLPDGQVLSTTFEVKDGGDTVARLVPDQDASDGTYENQAVAAGATPESVRAGITISASPPPGKMARQAATRGISRFPAGNYRLLTGNFLESGLYSVQDGWRTTFADAPIPLRGTERPVTLQVQCEAAPVVNIMAPLIPGEPGTLTWHLQGGRVLLDLTFSNPDVTTLLGHAAAGRIAEAAAAISKGTAIARKQLDGLPDHPICAVICAYVLLRTNQPQRLEGWVQGLADAFTWLPDSLLVLAEHLARLGKHDEAFNALLNLSERGLPFFSSGLSYAVDRLSFYRAAAASDDRSNAKSRLMKEPIEWSDAAEYLLVRLHGVAARTDFDRTILTYDGR
jgi:hypothetical protein